MFKLSQLLNYENIVIQCHDNPDPDTISCAFALQTYLKEHGREAPIVYGGRSVIRKSNLLLMIKELGIMIENVSKIEPPDVLVCVDCQYGEGNVAKLDAENTVNIDHHSQPEGDYTGIVMSGLGGCATLMWKLLKSEGFDMTAHRKVATALYYGLFTDTGNLAEISHPLDKDMRDELIDNCDIALINKLKNCNMTIDELEITGVALIRNIIDEEKRYAIFKAESCDQNILGIISDTCLQVDSVDICIVYSARRSDARFSVRSCSREVMASEFLKYITEGVGSGGGHNDKAGGYIQIADIEALGMDIDEYVKQKTAEYFDSFDVIDAANHDIDPSAMKKYKKKPIPKGYVVSAEVFEEGTPLLVRSLEGDAYIKASGDMYLMIGVLGETYPVKREKFEATYKPCDLPVNVDDDIYTPTVKNELTGEVKQLLPHMKPCLAYGEAFIYAQPLTRAVKIFTHWNPTGYMYGKPGDYIAFNCNDKNDVYVVEREIFGLTYDEMV